MPLHDCSCSGLPDGFCSTPQAADGERQAHGGGKAAGDGAAAHGVRAPSHHRQRTARSRFQLAHLALANAMRIACCFPVWHEIAAAVRAVRIASKEECLQGAQVSSGQQFACKHFMSVQSGPRT